MHTNIGVSIFTQGTWTDIAALSSIHTERGIRLRHRNTKQACLMPELEESRSMPRPCGGRGRQSAVPTGGIHPDFVIARAGTARGNPHPPSPDA